LRGSSGYPRVTMVPFALRSGNSVGFFSVVGQM
jgi:hypothetical protein